jgi:hypothetical protein
MIYLIDRSPWNDPRGPVWLIVAVVQALATIADVVLRFLYIAR